MKTNARSAPATTRATTSSTGPRLAPLHDEMRVGRSCRGKLCVARSMATGSIQLVRQIAKSPFNVMYAAMPRKVKTTSDFRLPPPMRTSVLLPHPEPSVMPTPKRNPPRRYESQVKLGRT